MQGLIKKFPAMEGKIRVRRARRLTAETDQAGFEEIFAYAQKMLGFTSLCTITGLDEGQTLGLIYHITRTDGIVLNLKFSVPKDKPVIKSMIKYFPISDIYEREIADLLGVQVEGLPEGNRYPLPEDWPRDEYPLRKDWKPKSVFTSTARSNAAGEGVKDA